MYLLYPKRPQDREAAMRIAIIGGGASGLVAAIEAGRAGAQVEILEAADRVGKPILATGNGRCNISNADILAKDYNRPAFVQKAMNMLCPEDVHLFFVDMGLLMYQGDEGRIYPYSGRASTVVDLLRLSAEEAGARERCGCEVTCVVSRKGGWEVCFKDGHAEGFDAVIVCVGGAPPQGLLPQDVSLTPARPALAALRCDTRPIKGLSGIRVRARLYLDRDAQELREAWLDVVDPVREEVKSGPEAYGEILFRDYGISGIAAFDMSRYVKPGQTIYIDMLPDMDPQEKVDFIYDTAMAHPTRSAVQVMAGMLPGPVARAVVKASGLNPDEPIVAEQEAVVLAMVSESFGLMYKGIADPKQAQVRCGGYRLDQFSAQTMACRAHPGLYVCGEALDVDGRCGGYNLHWAWTSGILAGRAAASGC